MAYLYNDSINKNLRKDLRKRNTKAELLLWQKIRGRKICNIKFHRQYGIMNYIVDFYCPALKLAIEIDGEYHNALKVKEADIGREVIIKYLDIQIIRFTNQEVINNIDNVLLKLRKIIKILLIKKFNSESSNSPSKSPS